MTNYFICTKPLQYFNCKNIASNIHEEKVLCIIPNFTNADIFIEKIQKYDSGWTKILVIDSRKSLNKIVHDTNEAYSIFVDTDLYSMINGSFFDKSNSISVYEEGIGTYKKKSNDFTNSKWKNTLLWCLIFFGVFNTRMGGNRKTQYIYLYNKRKYISIHKDLERKVKDFPHDFYTNYIRNRKLFVQIFNLRNAVLPENSRILLFLTNNSRTMDFNREFQEIQKDNSKFDLYIFKPHPYVGDLYADSENMFKDIMSEVLIFELLSRNNFIKIFHYDSSTELYIKHENIEFFNLKKIN